MKKILVKSLLIILMIVLAIGLSCSCRDNKITDSGNKSNVLQSTVNQQNTSTNINSSKNTTNSSYIRSEANSVFSYFSDDSYTCELAEHYISDNNFKFKLPAGVTPVEVNYDGAYNRTFSFTDDNTVTGTIVYGKKVDIENNIMEVFLSRYAEPPTGTREEKIEYILEYEDCREYSELKKEGWTDEELKEAEIEDKLNIDIIDLYYMDIFEDLTMASGIEEIFNSNNGRKIMFDDVAVGEQASGYSNGQVTAYITKYKDSETGDFEVAMIKRIDEGDYVKIFMGVADDPYDYKGVKLTPITTDALAKMECCIKEFN